MIKTDCFAYRPYRDPARPKPYCRALKGLYCKTEGRCSFYATQQEYEAAQERSRRRLEECGWQPKNIEG